MRVRVAMTLSVAVFTASLSGFVWAADGAQSVEERIAQVGRVVVAGSEPVEAVSAPAPAEQMAAEPAAEAASEAAPTAESVPVAAEAESAPAADVLALANSSGCMACHQVSVKVVGPAYQDVAAKYSGDAAARDMLIDKVKNGGVGTWGQIPMPPHGHVADADIATLVDWVLSM
jgi:cytochrome c